MRDPAKLRLVCTIMWFDKQILISWHPEKPDYIFFLHFHMQSVSCNADQLFQFTLVGLLKKFLSTIPGEFFRKKSTITVCVIILSCCWFWHYYVGVMVCLVLLQGATEFSTKWGTEPGCCWRDRNNFMQATQQF